MHEEEEKKIKEGLLKTDDLFKSYITEATPWFSEQDIVFCIIDLPNIDFLAVGNYMKKISLWDLWAANYQEQISMIQKEMSSEAKMKKSDDGSPMAKFQKKDSWKWR